MSTATSTGNTETTHHGDAPLWLAALAKAGYAARGVIYLIIGALALMQAFDYGGGTTGSRGALETILGWPGGTLILWFMVLGLLGYATWRFVQSILDADNHGTDGKGLVIRAGLIVSGVSHTLLAIYAASVAVSAAGSDGGGGGKEGLVAQILGWPGGKWIAVFVGLCIIGAGVAQFVKGYKMKFKEHFVIEPDKMQKISPICRFGLIARGVVFVIVGSMFAYAAFTQDPSDAGGLQEVLDMASQQWYGWVLLAVIALGLIAFGLYSIFEAIYRKIDQPDSWNPADQ